MLFGFGEDLRIREGQYRWSTYLDPGGPLTCIPIGVLSHWSTTSWQVGGGAFSFFFFFLLVEAEEASSKWETRMYSTYTKQGARAIRDCM